MTGPLRRVLVRAPREGDASLWQRYGWRSEPDFSRAVDEHQAFRAILEDSGADVIEAQAGLAPDPDAIYMMDATLVGPRGAIILRFGKAERRIETEAAEVDLAAAGIVITGHLTGEATVEGGDMVLLDERTLLVGRTYRTNDEGISQLRQLLPDTEVIAFDMPHLNGPDECLHLMSVLSPLDTDLALVYPRLTPGRLLELLAERGIATVEVPDSEFGTMGPNVLALGPRKALALDGNPETRRRMESAGVEVHAYRGEEISRKGDGGPTCLTRPLVRD